MDVKYSRKIKREAAIGQMGFFGLHVNVQSTLGIYKDYVENGQLDVFYTFQYCQDHLETYFSLVRGSLGANNNPNIQQFRSAYRKLLFCSPHISGDKKTNCNTEFPDELLEVSSALKNITLSSNIMPANAIEILEEYETLIENELEPYDEHMFAIVASNIEKGIIRKNMSKNESACNDCAYVFDENSHIQDSLLAKKMKKSQGFHQPSYSTMNILIASNEVMKILNQVDYIEFKSMVKTIFIEYYSMH